jgi:TolB-like protein
MPILPDFEYDIFISYRQNDNQDGWVTSFVEQLQKELKATIKDPVSIYFDANPKDGLQETHHVDKSLEGKLRCLIFIPILSQTYCDPKSFAWKHEFCAFNELAQSDSLGREIKLRTGNVASRILPVKIHDIEEEDKAAFENEIGGVLRAIEFIYKESGVNRPLKSTDLKTDNLNKTEYHNQINKVANAIKDILSALKSPKQPGPAEVIAENIQPATKSYRKIMLIAMGIILISLAVYWLYPRITPAGNTPILDKSIAVLPFTDLSPDHDQEYLGDGIAEYIINSLSQINDLKVIGRTSSFQFKNQNYDVRLIGEKLGVATVLEGSVMKSGNKIRITAQLVNVNDGRNLWSEQYDRELNDIFKVQDEIARMIVDKMKLSILYLEQGGRKKIHTTNLNAYENFLQGQHLLNDGIHNARLAQPFFEKAGELDPAYVDAWYGLALSYYLLPLINELKPHEAVMKVDELVTKMLNIDSANYMPHQLLFMSNYYYTHDWKKAEEEYNKSNRLRNEPTIVHALFLHDIYNDQEAAILELTAFLKINPLNKDALRYLAHIYSANRQHELANETLQQIIDLDSLYGPAYCELGTLQLVESDYTKAFENFKKCESISPQWSGKTGMIISLVKTGKVSEAKALASQTDQNMNAGTKAYIHLALGETDQGFEWLEKAYEESDPIMAQIRDLPALFPIASDPRYQQLVRKMNFPR